MKLHANVCSQWEWTKLRQLLVIVLLGLGIVSTYGQTKTVSGIVKSESGGEPLVGATVKVKETNTGGITETKKICDMAQVYEVGVQIHVCGGPIATAAALQVEAAIPNFVIHEEHNANLTSGFIKSSKYYYAPKNGAYEIPELPGIGQEMSDEYIAHAKKVVIK